MSSPGLQCVCGVDGRVASVGGSGICAPFLRGRGGYPVGQQPGSLTVSVHPIALWENLRGSRLGSQCLILRAREDDMGAGD